MHMKKRFLVTLLAAALVIAALAIPSFALDSTMKYVSERGTIGTGAGATTWGTTLGASTTQATATVTTSRNMFLVANIDATVFLNSRTYRNIDSDGISGTQATVSVTNVVPGVGTGEIRSVTATYVAGTLSLGALTIS